MILRIKDLIEQVRSQADREDTKFVSDANITYWLQKSYEYVYKLISEKSEDYFTRSVIMDTDETSHLDLKPVGMWEIRAIDLYFSGDYYETIPRASWIERDRFQRGSVYGGFRNYFDYRYVPKAGKLIGVLPKRPNNRVVVHFIPEPPQIGTGYAEVDFGIDEYIVLRAAMFAKIKEGLTNDDLKMKEEECLAMINNTTSKRDRGFPRTVTVYENASFNYYDRSGAGSPNPEEDPSILSYEAAVELYTKEQTLAEAEAEASGITVVESISPLLTLQELVARGVSEEAFLSFGWLEQGLDTNTPTSDLISGVRDLNDVNSFIAYALAATPNQEVDISIAFPNLGSSVARIGFLAVRSRDSVTAINSLSQGGSNEIGKVFRADSSLAQFGDEFYKIYFTDTLMWTDINVNYPYRVFIQRGV